MAPTGPLRAAVWLRTTRVRAWCIMLAVAMCAWGGGAILGQIFGLSWSGLGGDFPCFYAAGTMALHGQAALVYDPGTIGRAEHALGGMKADGFLPFFYPPPFLLFCAAIAALPYWLAFAVFMAAGAVPLAMAAARLLPAGNRVWPFLAFPGLWITFIAGQNGLMSAACLAWFMLLADPGPDREEEGRPMLAGACLGLLACKPQLAVAVPFALIAAGRWRGLIGAAGCLAATWGLSAALLGGAPWVAFVRYAGTASTAITGGMLMQARIQSAFMAARLMGAGLGVAAVVQGLVAGMALVLLVLFARTRPRGAALGAATAAAALLITPYCMDYDLVLLGPALAWMVAAGVAAGWHPYQRIAVLAGFLLPIASSLIAVDLGVQIAPAVLALVLGTMVLPALRGGRRAAAGGPAFAPHPR